MSTSNSLVYKPEPWFVYTLRDAYARSQWCKCAKRFDRFFEKLINKHVAAFRLKSTKLCSSPGCGRAG